MFIIAFLGVALLIGPMAGSATGETSIGGVDLIAYCNAKYDFNRGGLFFSDGELRLKENNAGGWRCYQVTRSISPIGSPSSPQFNVADNYFENEIHMSDACIRQYGPGTRARYASWSDPNSWRCYI